MGSPAEGHRQRAASIAVIAGIARHRTGSKRQRQNPTADQHGLTIHGASGPALSDEKRLEQGENSTAGRSESIRVMAG